MQPNVTNRVDYMAMLLLGIRMALKQDLHCTVAELVYGATLRLPAEFFDNSSSDDLDPVSYVAKLKATMQPLRATPPCHHTRHKVYMYVSKNLCHCTRSHASSLVHFVVCKVN